MVENLELYITQQHIDKADLFRKAYGSVNSEHCPISIAMSQHHPHRRIYTGINLCQIMNEKGNLVEKTYTLSPLAEQFVEDYDNLAGVSPCKLLLYHQLPY